MAVNHKSRMQTRRLRSDGWDPIAHNKYVALKKRFKRLRLKYKALGREFNKLSYATQSSTDILNNFASTFQKIRSDYNNVR